MKKKYLFIFGTRPEAIKMIPLIIESSERGIPFDVCITGQHKMVFNLLKRFNITPDFNLKIMKDNQTLNYIVYETIKLLEEKIEEEYQFVFVHGDTSTALASSIWAFNKKMKVVHIESGLRSNEKRNPFPEEMNRILIDQLSDFHFAPTIENKNNLLKENISPDNIYVCGNTIIDMINLFIKKNEVHKNNENQVLITCHRRENFDKFDEIFRVINKLATNNQNMIFKFPMHPNPLIRKKAKELLNASNISLIDSLEYPEFIKELINSSIVLTDSGGVLEESSYLNKSVLILRDSLERTELLSNRIRLVGHSEKNIMKVFDELINLKDSNNISSNILGNGNTSKIILDTLKGFKND